MTVAIAVFLGLTLTLAASVVLYAANLRFVALESTRSFPKWALVPLATPVFSWRLGARALPVAFALVLVLYVVFQIVAQIGAFP